MGRRAVFPTISAMKLNTTSFNGDIMFVRDEHDMFHYDSTATVFDEKIIYEATGFGVGGFVRQFNKANRLSGYADFATAIATIGDNGELYIDVDETLAGVAYNDVPEGLTLIGAGGVLYAVAATDLTIRGEISSNVKMLDHADHLNRGIIDIILGEINPRWFGALNSAEPGTDPSDNVNAFYSAWLAGRKVGGNENGGTVLVPGPAQFDVEKLNYDDTITGGGQRRLRGDSQRGSLLRLAVGSNTGLLKATANTFFNGSIDHISFDGLKAFNPTATEPVVEINSSNFEMHSCHITDGNTNGLEFRTGGQARLESIDSEKHNGWGFYIHAADAFTLGNCGCDQCGIGGLLIEHDEGDSNDKNRFSSYIVDNFYAEACPIAVKIAGVGNVFINGITTANSSTSEVLRLATYTDTSGIVWESSGNIIYIRGATGDHQKIVIEKGCINNIIYIPPHEKLNIVIEDANAPGLNRIVASGNQLACVRDIPPVTDKDYANVVQNSDQPTHKTSFQTTSGTATVSFEPSFMVHPASSHVPAQNAPVCLAITDTTQAPVNNTLRSVKDSMPAGDYWINMLVWYDYNAFLRFQLQRTGGDYYDWTTGTFLPSPNLSQQTLTLRIEGGKPQWISVPFTLPSLEDIFCTAFFHSLHNGNMARIPYGPAMVDKENAGLIYMNDSGVIQGSNDHFEALDADLPPVAEVPKGTKIWDLTAERYVYNRGTDWIGSVNGLSITSVDSPFQAHVDDFIIADSTTAKVRINTPLNAVLGDTFSVKKVNQVSINSLLVDAAASGVLVQDRITKDFQNDAVLISVGEVQEFIYNGTNWGIKNIALAGEYLEAWQATVILNVPSGGQIIQWTHVPLFTGQTTNLASHVAGVLTSNIAAAISIRLSAIWEYQINSNNQDAKGLISDTIVGGSLIPRIEIVSSFTSPRTGTFPFSQNTSGVWIPSIGDTLQFDAFSDVGQSGDTDLAEALLFLSVG